jgi:hypothetical protein
VSTGSLCATSSPMVDERQAHEVATAFLAAFSTPKDQLVLAAYDALARQSDRLFNRITRSRTRRHLQVEFTRCRVPYGSDDEMIAAVRTTLLLEVTTTTEGGRPHPVLGNEMGGVYDRFRAVHDIVGHVATGFGFDRHGELGAWQAQDAYYTGLARHALGTELHGEHSVCWTTGEVAEHKATLLPADMLNRARRGLIPQRQRSAGRLL